MTRSAVINVRVTPETKKEVERIFAELGLTTSEAVNLFLRQVVLHRGLPFDVRIPNEETIAAMKEDVSKLPAFDSVESLMEDLLSEED